MQIIANAAKWAVYSQRHPSSVLRGVQILDGPFAGVLSPLLVLRVQFLEVSKFWTVPLPVSSPLASAPSAVLRGIQILDGPFASALSSVLRGVQILDSPFAGILSPLLVPQFSF